MTPNELRALAEALLPMAAAPCFDGIDIERAAAYLRALADAQPVTWIAHNLTTGHVKWTTDRCRARGWTRSVNLRVKPLYAHPAPAVPAGWKVVPVEPTPEMLSAVGMMDGYDWHAPGCSPDADHANWYSAMIAAAPAVPQAEPQADAQPAAAVPVDWMERLKEAVKHIGYANVEKWYRLGGEDMIEQAKSDAVTAYATLCEALESLYAAPAVPQPVDRCRSSETSDPKATGPASPERPASNREDAAATVAAGSGEQAEPIDPHMILAEDRFPDVPAERWNPCPQCGEDFDRECPICDGLGKVLATDGEQAEPKREPLTYEQLVSACYTYRHDFGLLDPDEQHLVIEEAGRWAKAFGIGGRDE